MSITIDAHKIPRSVLQTLCNAYIDALYAEVDEAHDTIKRLHGQIEELQATADAAVQQTRTVATVGCVMLGWAVGEISNEKMTDALGVPLVELRAIRDEVVDAGRRCLGLPGEAVNG